MAKKIEWLEILFWIIMIILFIMILSRIFGHSATDIQIYLAIFTGLFIIMGHILKLNNNIGKLNREIGEIKIQMISSFKKVREDISKLTLSKNKQTK